MTNNNEGYTTYVQSTDGTKIHYEKRGKGPGLVIIHGAFRDSSHYQKLAQELDSAFTVYTMDRRGRNGSGEKGSAYSIEKECEDVEAIIQKESVSFIFGHSFGGLVTLEAGLQFPSIHRIAVYEPPISINGSVPTAWLPLFEAQLRKGDFVGASISLIKGLQMGGWMRRIPTFALRPLFNKVSQSDEWQQNVELLKTVASEAKVGVSLHDLPDRYRQIKTQVFILSGSKSPAYLQSAANELAKIVPHSQQLLCKGLDHNGPDVSAPEQIAAKLTMFFKGGNNIAK